MINDDVSRIYIPVKLQRVHLNELLKKHVKSMDLGSRIQLERIQILELNELVKVELQISGRIDTIIDASFKVLLNKNDKRIDLSEVLIQLRDTGILSSGLNWALDSLFQNKIESMLKEQLEKVIDLLMKQVLKERENLNLPEGFGLNLSIESLKWMEILTKADCLTLSANIKAKFHIISDPNTFKDLTK